MTKSNDALATLAKDLVHSAAEKNIALRAAGGIAIYMICESIGTHQTLQRANADLDFVAARKDFDALIDLFAAHGATVRARKGSEIAFERDGVGIELDDTIVEEDYRIDLTSRLGLSSPTLPLADLLLIKLARKRFEEKDIQDCIALLLDHRVAKGEAEEQIDYHYVATLTKNRWELFHTVYDNTITLEKSLGRYLEPEEGQLVWRRIELIQGDMDRQPKSLGWMMRQFFKRPSEVAT